MLEFIRISWIDNGPSIQILSKVDDETLESVSVLDIYLSLIPFHIHLEIFGFVIVTTFEDEE